MDVTEWLSLDRENVAAAAVAYESLAGLAPPGQPELPPWRKANDLAMAAGYWAAVDQPRARLVFRRAADLYFQLAAPKEGEASENFRATASLPRRLAMVKAVSLSIAANDAPGLERKAGKWLFELSDWHSPDEILGKLLATTFLLVQEPESKFRQPFRALCEKAAHRLPAHRAGCLGWRLSTYVEIAKRLASLQDATPLTALEFHRSMRPFAESLDETLRSAQSARTHWKRLYSRLLPIEPEALGMCIAAETVIQRQIPNERDRQVATSDFTGPFRAYLAVAAEVRRITIRPEQMPNRLDFPWREEEPPSLEL